MRDDTQLPVKNDTNKFILVNNRDLHTIKLKDWVIVKVIVKAPTIMHTLCFGLGEFKTVLQGALLNFIQTFLELTLDGMHMF